MEKLLEAVTTLSRKCRLDDFQTATAISLSWYYKTRHRGEELSDGVWAWRAVQKVRQGRDLPGCGTSVSDALRHCWQGAGMGEVMDRYPGPDRLAEHRELLEKVLSELSDIRKEIAELKIMGVRNKDVAEHLGVTPGRVSQITREIAEKFQE